MATIAWIVMSSDQRAAGEALNDGNVALGAQEVDSSLANNLGFGTLMGQWVAPARLLNDSAYSRWVPTLGTLPIHVMDSDTLFVPVDIG